MAKLRRPKNRLIQPRLRGLAGPFFQQVAPAQLIHTPGNFIAATAGDEPVELFSTRSGGRGWVQQTVSGVSRATSSGWLQQG